MDMSKYFIEGGPLSPQPAPGQLSPIRLCRPANFPGMVQVRGWINDRELCISQPWREGEEARAIEQARRWLLDEAGRLIALARSLPPAI